ncbi:reverse transcriptase domain-containing protein, partial [Tanacetum coccineum]
MPMWCHMFNSTLIRAARAWFDELPPESIDGYKDFKAAFLAYFMQQKKYVKDPVEIHNIKQRDGETIEDFIEFMHGVNNRELTKRLDKRVLKTMEEMMITTTAFIRGETVAASKKKGHTLWKPQDQPKRHVSERKSDFREGLLVIEAKIGGQMIHHMYVDGGSSTEVLYEHCFNLLRPEIKSQMVTATTSLTSFSEETIWPLGKLRLLVMIGDAEHSTKAWMNFMIVRSLSPYNGIIGRPGIRKIQEVPSTTHIMLKFPVDRGIVTIRSTILIPTECATVTTSSKEILKEAEVRHKNFKVALHPNFPDQEVAIGGTLSAKGRTELCSLLKENLDIFVWQSSDITGVPRSVAEHRLNIREGYSSVRQKRKGARPWNMPKPSKRSSRRTDGATTRGGGQKDLTNQVGRNIEVYVDDLLIKSHTETEMLRDMDETFRTTEAVLRLPSPRTIKDVQSLNGKLASLNRFLSKLAEKSLPLFKTLKKCIKKSDFHWTPEVEQAFKQPPKLKEELIIYLSASHRAISAVLMTKRGTVQVPVYFVSRVLQGPKLNYTPMEKLVLALVFAAKRLRRYIQAHPIAVITDQPIKQIISRPDIARQLKKWSVVLGEHNITYRPRTFVKGQILADFLVEKPDEAPPDTSVVETPQDPWILFTDGSSCVDGSGVGLILTSPEGTEFTYALRFQFTASNNEAEYEALIVGLRIAAHMGVRNVHVSVDSKLVANQVLGTYVAKEENMIKYLEKAKSLVSGFANFSISQVPRSKNKKADALSKIASTSFAHLSKQVLVEVLKEKSIQEREVETVVEEYRPTWMTPIMEYLKDRTLPDDRKEASKLRIKARQYELLEGVLYRRSFLKPWLRCVGPLQADYVIREIHEGSCSMHAGPWSVVAKAMRLGYYWPTMHQDARDTIRKCKDCQIHRLVPSRDGNGSGNFGDRTYHPHPRFSASSPSP